MPHAPYLFADMPADLAVPLIAEERKFLAEYIVDLDVAGAVSRSGVYRGRTPKPKTFEACGNRILDRYHVKLALHWLQSYRARHSEINAEKVLKHLWSIATADATEISSVRVYSCRHCHGEDFLYQWINEFEFGFAKKKNEAINDDGGYGYDPERRPHAKCPQCRGLGESYVYLKDTRDYSPEAKLLYKGAKHTRHGIEVMTHDSMRAMEQVIKILGLGGGEDPTENQMRIIVEGGLPD